MHRFSTKIKQANQFLIAYRPNKSCYMVVMVGVKPIQIFEIGHYGQGSAQLQEFSGA
jgi:hypothetical protein